MTLSSLLAVISMCFSTQEGPATRPSSSQAKASEKELRTIYTEQYAEKNSKALLTEAKSTKDNIPAKYVLLRDARDFAIEKGEVTLALEAGLLIATGFKNPDRRWLAKLFASARKAARTPDQLRYLHSQYLEVAISWAQMENFRNAEMLAKEASRIAKALRSPILIEHSSDLSDAIDGLAKESEKVSAAKLALEDDPENTAAALHYGLYLCFAKDEWDKGLRLIAEGEDPTFASAAKAELAKDPLKAGDAWERAGKKKGLSVLERRRYLGRACHWLGTTLSQTSGVTRAKLNARMVEMEALARLPVDLLAMVDPEKDGVEGAWSRNAKGITCNMGRNQRIKVPYVPPVEYDLEVVVERVGGGFSVFFGLPVAESTVLVEFDAYPSGKGASMPGFAETYKEKVFADTLPHTIEVFVRRKSVTIKVDGKIVLDWVAASFKSADPGIRSVPNHKGLFWGTFQSYYVVKKLTLRGVTGAGKRLR